MSRPPRVDDAWFAWKEALGEVRGLAGVPLALAPETVWLRP